MPTYSVQSKIFRQASGETDETFQARVNEYCEELEAEAPVGISTAACAYDRIVLTVAIPVLVK